MYAIRKRKWRNRLFNLIRSEIEINRRVTRILI